MRSPIPRTTVCSLLLIGLSLCAPPGRAQQSRGAQATPRLPDTAAGRLLATFLDALNSGSRMRLKEFADRFLEPADDAAFSERFADENLRLFRDSGGFAVRRVGTSSEPALDVLVEGLGDHAWGRFQLFLEAEAPEYVKPVVPYRIAGLGLHDVESPVEFLPRRRLSTAELRSNIDRLMVPMARRDAFSGVVYVAKGATPVYARAFGLASKTWDVPNRIDTRFNLASITKMFTAVAIAQLVERGRLHYEDTVGQLLPDYPNQAVADTVTVHHLLSHTSGMIGGRSLAEKSPHHSDGRTVAGMLGAFSGEPLAFTPGQRFEYSNAGFILLGAIVEKVSGMSYFDYVRSRVFEPAGMRDTDFYELDAEVGRLATGFKDAPGGGRRSNIFDLDVKGSPAGMAYSTGADMARFHAALTNHTLLGAAALERLWTGVTEDVESGAEYGYGAFIKRYNGVRIVSHGGGWMGVTNHFDMYPELGYSVVVLSNYDDDPTAIAYKLREWLTQGVGGGRDVEPTAPDLRLTVESTPRAARVGLPVTFAVAATNAGGTAHGCVVDLEVRDAGGTRVHQQFTMQQRLDPGQTKTYSYTWTPAAPGTYAVDVGAFGPSWSPKLGYVSGAASVTVAAAADPR